MKLKTNEIARLLGVTGKSITLWARECGMPKVTHGVYDLETTLQWWRQNIVLGGGVDINESKKIYWQAKAAREKIAADLESKAVMDAAKTMKQMDAAGRHIRESIESIAPRIAPLVAAESGQFECEKIIESETRHILSNLAELLLPDDMKGA